MKFVALLWILFAAAPTLAAPSACQSRLVKLLERISPPNEVLAVKSKRVSHVSRLSPKDLHSLKGNLQAKTLVGGPMTLQVVSPADFFKVAAPLEKKGFWVLFNPSGAEARVESGHFTILVKDTVFNRNVDEAGAKSMTSLPAMKLGQALDEHKMLSAQFFETSEESVDALYKFLHDRVWFHHQGNPAYESKYVPLPITRDKQVPRGENCLTFSLPWTQECWVQGFPFLSKLRDEIGSMTVSEIPARQLSYNTQAPAYRGTFLVTKDPDSVRHLMLKDGMSEDVTGKGFLFDGAAREVAP